MWIGGFNKKISLYNTKIIKFSQKNILSKPEFTTGKEMLILVLRRGLLQNKLCDSAYIKTWVKP